ncbi:MAG: outer membrane beta-barrel protein [Terriglobales bacterium]|jgi:opacity protein-like surface antigen
MLKTAALISVGLFLFTSLALSQDDGRFDASLNGGPVLTKSTSGNGIQQSATIGSNFFGTFRFKFRPRTSIEFNFGSAKNSQIYQSNVDFHTLDSIRELSGTFAYDLYDKGKFQTFVLAGAGALRFAPKTTWLILPDFLLDVPNRVLTPLNTTNETGVTYIFGAGVDYQLPWRFALRLQYRGLVYNAPDFNVTAVSGSSVSLATGTKAFMSEPSVGIVFKF